jgi:hypothetical protein
MFFRRGSASDNLDRLLCHNQFSDMGEHIWRQLTLARHIFRNCAGFVVLMLLLRSGEFID